MYGGPSSPEDGRRKPRRGCCLGCAGAVLAPVVGLAFVLWLNNRPPKDVVIPTLAMPAVNGYYDVKRSAQMLRGRIYQFPASVMNYNPATYTLRDYAAAYREAKPALDALRAALRKPYQNPPDRIPGLGFPGYAMLREMARTLSGAAEYEAKVGRYREALDLGLDGLELGAIMPRGGALIADLVGEAIEAISVRHAEEYIAKLTPAELAHVAARLERISSRRVPYSEIVAGEGRTSVAMLRFGLTGISLTSPAQYYSSMRSLAEVPGDRLPTAREGARMARLALGNKSAMLRQELAYYVAAAREAEGPYTGRTKVPAPDAPFMSGMPDLIVGARRKHVAREAVVDVLRAEVALLRYRADHGKYPAQLNTLAPKYLAKVPDDVCAGRPRIPLRYHVNDGGRSYVLYSVGPDMRDDLGAFQRVAAQGGDIVAGHLNGR